MPTFLPAPSGGVPSPRSAASCFSPVVPSQVAALSPLLLRARRGQRSRTSPSQRDRVRSPRSVEPTVLPLHRAGRSALGGPDRPVALRARTVPNRPRCRPGSSAAAARSGLDTVRIIIVIVDPMTLLDGSRTARQPDDGPTAADPIGARLLAAAAEVFAEQGYAGTRVAEIARRAGLTTGAIYSRYRGKAELLAAAIDASSTDELDALFTDHRFEGRMEDILTIAGSHLVERTSRRPAGARGLLLEAFVAARHEPDGRRRCSPARSAIRRDRLADVVESAKAGGGIDPDARHRLARHLLPRRRPRLPPPRGARRRRCPTATTWRAADRPPRRRHRRAGRDDAAHRPPTRTTKETDHVHRRRDPRARRRR